MGQPLNCGASYLAGGRAACDEDERGPRWGGRSAGSFRMHNSSNELLFFNCILDNIL